MTYGIFSNTGNVVSWFDSRREALVALADLAIADPTAANDLAAVPFDARGHACGPAVLGSTLLAPAKPARQLR